MSELIFKVEVADGDIFWLDDEVDIIPSFGKVVAVIQYYLTNPQDITDAVNGNYLK